MTEPNPFSAAVGTVAQESAKLESVVALVAWGLAGLEQSIARIVVPDGMSRMLDLIKRLAPLRITDAELQDAVINWVGRCRVAYDQRGEVIHSVWFGDGGHGPHVAGDLKPFGRSKTEKTTVDLLQLALEMEALAGEDAWFLGRLAAEVPGPWSIGPLPDTPSA